MQANNTDDKAKAKAFAALLEMNSKIKELNEGTVEEGLEKIHTIVEENYLVKREFFNKIRQNNHDSKKNFVARIFHLLSKKYKKKIDESFINEQIKFYILKEKIQDQNLLNFVNDTQSIKVDKEEYCKERKINNMEKRIRLYLAIELFYPLDLTFQKYQQLYYRNFVRLTRIYIDEKEYWIKVKKFEKAFANIESKYLESKRTGMELIKTKRTKEFKLLFGILDLLIKKKLKTYQSGFMRQLLIKDKSRWLAYLINKKAVDLKRESYYEILKRALGLGKQVLLNNQSNNSQALDVFSKEQSKEILSTSDQSYRKTFNKLETFGIENAKKKGGLQHKRFFKFLEKFLTEKQLKNALTQLRAFQHSLDIIETTRTPLANSSKNQTKQMKNKTSIQSISNTLKAKKREIKKITRKDNKNVQMISEYNQKKIEETQTRNQPEFEVIEVEDKTFLLEPKTVNNAYSQRQDHAVSHNIDYNQYSYQIPLVNKSTTFTQEEQLKRYKNVLQTSLKRIATVSDLGQRRKMTTLSQKCPSKKLFDLDFNKKVDLYGSYMQKSPKRFLGPNNTVKSVSSLFRSNNYRR